MKRNQLLLLLFFSLLWTVGGFAQEIRFEEGKSWKQIVRKAEKAGQLIFVDCYTSWCGPCKVLSATVFTQDTVGGFFNYHFVNAKLDLEKEADGQMLRKKYRVESFPTLLFIDPATLEEVHRIVGLATVNSLLQEAALAIDSRNNTAGLAKRYVAGERSTGLLLSYQRALEKAMLPLNRKIAGEYLDSLRLEQLATAENWNRIVSYVDDVLARPLQLVLANRSRFYTVAGREAVDYKLQYALESAVQELVDHSTEYDLKRWEALVDYLKIVDHTGAPGALACLYSLACERERDFPGLLENMRVAMKYNVFRESAAQEYFNRFLPVFEKCGDSRVVKEVIGMMNEKCSLTDSWYEKADLMKIKALLETQLGDTAAAARSKADEQQYRQRGDEAGEWM